jgi:catechol 2,3-dioxygenase-like lactoylglutathione lyase family enzyme
VRWRTLARVEPLGRLEVVAIDCNDAEPLVEFWCAVLGVEVANRDDDWVSLEPSVDGGASLAFQVVPEPKQGKNRLHLDVEVRQLESATLKAEELGATSVGDIVVEDDGGRFQVMRDPGGNEFCLVAME